MSSKKNREAAEELGDEEEVHYAVCKRGRSEYSEPESSRRRRGVSTFIDDIALVDSDEDEEEEDPEDDDFIDAGDEVADINYETRSCRRRSLLERDDRQEDVEEIVRRLEERYASGYNVEHDEDEEATVVEQQALLPSVRDPKLWVVKCQIGHEREVAVCMMQKLFDKGSELQIRSAIALDHLESYIYVEADKEAHVKQAVRGMRYVYPNYNIIQVPLKEMADVLRVQSKVIGISRDAWVRMKIGLYKGDLARVVEVDDVRHRATIKLIPRIDLHTLANKMEGRVGPKTKAFTPPARFMNINEARELHIRVERYRVDGDYFEKIDGMLFKDGFLYKTVSLKSLSTQNVQPSLNELEKFRQPAVTGNLDMSSLSTLFAIRKKGHFVKGDKVIVVKGDLRNLKGMVEKVEEDLVYIKHDMQNAKGLPKTLMISDKELCKYFEYGNHVKVVSGAMEGATGMVVSVEGHVVNILSDATKEELRVFADNVVESTEGTIVSRFAHLKAPPAAPLSMRAPAKFAGKHGGGRGHDSLIGSTVKISRDQYKGSKGRIKGIRGSRVWVELESQMKTVEVDRGSISACVAVSLPSSETSRYSLGSETPMHPSQTPQHPSMTPMRDSRATSFHSGMRTPLHDQAWDPYSPSPPRIASSS